MKKLGILVLCLLGSFAFAQDNDANPIYKTKREVLQKNKVKVQISTEYNLVDNNEVPNKICDTTYFDPQGNATKEVYVNNEAPVYISIEDYTYNESGKITYKIDREFFKGKKGPVEQTFYEYDGKGNLTAECTIKSKAKKYPRSACSVYIYKDNQLSKYIDNEKVDYYYVHKGDTICKYDKEDNKMVDCYLKDLLLMQNIGTMKWVYEYNSNGLLIKTTCYSEEHLYSEVSFEYENNLITKSTTINHHGKKNTTVDRYSYLYYN